MVEVGIIFLHSLNYELFHDLIKSKSEAETETEEEELGEQGFYGSPQGIQRGASDVSRGGWSWWAEPLEDHLFLLIFAPILVRGLHGKVL